MSKYQIALTERVYHTLLTVAQRQGITPAEWIATQLPLASPEEQSLPDLLPDLLADLVGTIDSQAEPHHQFQKTPFGEGVAAKLSRQGLQRS